jgi:glycosyltransferase involved in cell wall biosynthesis
MKRVMAILPAYNEEAHLPAVLTELKQYIETILVIDDGSVDRTVEIARDLGINVLSRGYNLGVGQTTRDGLAWALDRGFDAAVMLDSDGQHKPSEITRFLEKFERDHNRLIIGARDYKQMPLRRRIPNTLGRWMLSSAIREYLPDNQSGYRLVEKELIVKLLDTKESGFNFMVEMIILCLASGWEIGWVPISTIYGDEKSHQNALYQIKGFIKMCRQAQREVRKQRS